MIRIIIPYDNWKYKKISIVCTSETTITKLYKIVESSSKYPEQYPLMYGFKFLM